MHHNSFPAEQDVSVYCNFRKNIKICILISKQRWVRMTVFLIAAGKWNELFWENVSQNLFDNFSRVWNPHFFCVHSIQLALHLNLYFYNNFLLSGRPVTTQLIMEIAKFFSRFISGQFHRFSELKCVFNSFKTFELSHMGEIERIFYCCMDRQPTASFLIDLWAKNLFWKCSVFDL